jgi:hypothetical protein
LKTFNGEEITIINVGQYLELAGPDFSMLKPWESKNGLEMSKFILNLQIGMCIITKEMKPTKT